MSVDVTAKHIFPKILALKKLKKLSEDMQPFLEEHNITDWNYVVELISEELEAREAFVAWLKSQIEKHEEWFNTNPHDEYFGYNHGKLDAFKEMLEALE